MKHAVVQILTVFIVCYECFALRETKPPARDFYEVLGLERTASTQEIQKAYKRLSLKLHPDRKGGSKEGFQVLQEAYEALSDPEKRRNYDRTGDPTDSFFRPGYNNGPAYNPRPSPPPHNYNRPPPSPPAHYHDHDPGGCSSGNADAIGHRCVCRSGMQCVDESAGNGCHGKGYYLGWCRSCKCRKPSSKPSYDSYVPKYASCEAGGARVYTDLSCACVAGKTCYDSSGANPDPSWGCWGNYYSKACKTCSCVTTTTTTTTLGCRSATDLGNGICECGSGKICYADLELARRGCGESKLRQFRKSCETCSCDEDVKHMEDWRCCKDTSYMGSVYGAEYKWMKAKQMLWMIVGCPDGHKMMTDTSLCDNLN